MTMTSWNDLRQMLPRMVKQEILDPITTLWRSGFSRARCKGVKALYAQDWKEWEAYYDSLPDPDAVIYE